MGRLIVKQYNKTMPLQKGKTLLFHLQELNVGITAFCSGRGECKACLVKVDDPGWLNPLTDVERRLIKSPENRLACQAKITRDDVDIYVEIPQYPKYKILERGKRINVPLNPFVKKRRVDSRELVHWKTENLGEYGGEIYGLALDIGTTTIRMCLVDLETGRELFTYSMLNPQIRYGDNVIDRIYYSTIEDQKYLEITVREAINEMLAEIPVNLNHIYEVTVVGNSVMRDIFVGHSVETLGRHPFKPVSTNPVNAEAKELGIRINHRGNIYALPLIGHFVGADALAVILGTEMYKSSDVTLALDIGTNTEIAIGNCDRILVTSCASGPAFEGSGLKCGIGAVEGAIQKVRIQEGGEVQYETICGKPPIGLCGSGLIDALAQMLENEILDWTGKFTGGRKEFVITDDGERISLDGDDVDNLKLAKAAIAVGLTVAMKKYGVNIQEVKKLYLAGAFGTYIDLSNALKIGLLPDIPLEKVEKVGNIALEGARQALISQRKRSEAENISKDIESIRLEKEEDFHDRFMERLSFDKYRYIQSQ